VKVKYPLLDKGPCIEDNPTTWKGLRFWAKRKRRYHALSPVKPISEEPRPRNPFIGAEVSIPTASIRFYGVRGLHGWHWWACATFKMMKRGPAFGAFRNSSNWVEYCTSETWPDRLYPTTSPELRGYSGAGRRFGYITAKHRLYSKTAIPSQTDHPSLHIPNSKAV
jgi:hypothetical protein